jgi:acyl carrier protein
MTREAIMAFNREAMLKYLSDELGVDIEDINDDTLLFTDGYLDSFSVVDLVTYLESSANISINPSEVNLDNLDSVGRIITFVDVKTQ